MTFAQSGSTLIDTCFEFDSFQNNYNRTYLISTDSGSYYISQHMFEFDSSWTTVAINHATLYNEINTYDSTNRLIEKILLSKDSAIWNKYRRTFFNYDINNRLVDSIVQLDSLGVLNNSSLWVRQFDTSGYILFNETKTWGNNQWINYERTEWSYDSLGIDTSIISYIGDTSNWIPLKKILRKFNQFGLIDSLSFSWSGTTWNNLNRDQFFYQAANKDTLEISYTGIISIWDTIFVVRNSYDSLGNKVFSQRLRYINSQWENFTQVFYVYDSLNRVILETLQLGHDTIWGNSSRKSTFYSSLENTYVINEIWWQDSLWICTDFISTTYFSPFSYHRVSGNMSDCNSPQIDEDVTHTYDLNGRLTYYEYDGHAGNSHGSGSYLYDNEGFLYEEHGYSSSMGGLERIIDCYHYHPLINTFDKYSFYSCPGDSIHFISYPNGGVPPYNYQWKFNNTLLAETNNSPFFISQNKNGCYKLIIIDAQGNYYSDSIYVHIHPDLDLGNDTIVCTNTSLTLSPGSFSTYLWQDGTSDSTYIASYIGSGNDTVTYWVSVIDSTGCINADSISVFYDPCLSIIEFTYNEINIFPNPIVHGQELIINSYKIPSSIIIKTVSGQIIYNNRKSSQVIPTLNFQPGIYFIILNYTDRCLTRQLVVL